MSQRHNRNGNPVCSVGEGELFDGFFEPGKTWHFHKDQLVDARARRVFEMMGRACDAGVYPYQLPLEGRSGPWVEAEGRKLLMLSSYDYLGLIGDPRIDDDSECEHDRPHEDWAGGGGFSFSFPGLSTSTMKWNGRSQPSKEPPR